MKTFAQVEPVQVYEVPSYRLNRADEAVITVATALTLLVALVISMIFWGVILWRLPSKAGYKGAAQWVWFLLMYFPLTGVPAILAFTFAPWPVNKQLEKSESQLDELRRQSKPKSQPLTSVDDELKQLRRQLGQ